MINTKDVITIRVPYPDTTSILARIPHMYICTDVSDPSCELVKCQSFKPYHTLVGSSPVCRIVEQPNNTRNPFRHPTIIDLDKLFIAMRTLLPDSLITTQGVCDALLVEIKTKINATVERITLTEAGLQTVNYAI